MPSPGFLRNQLIIRNIEFSGGQIMSLEPDFPGTFSSSVGGGDLSIVPAEYRGWKLTTKMINGQLWIRCYHPQEAFARYGYPIARGGISAALAHVRFTIDLAIKLEAARPHHECDRLE